MSIEHRIISDAEFPEWRRLVRRAFHVIVHPDDVQRLKDDRAETDRLFGAFDGDQLVGTGGTDSHVMTVPGGAQLPTAAIAYVSTITSHRRRGVLKGMMKSLLAQAQERAEPLAALWASEAGIYSRFGFGQATVAEEWNIDPSRAAFGHMPETPGITRFVDRDDALKLMPGVWSRASKRRAGFLDRSERRWRYNFFDEERVRGDWTAMFHVVYEEDGRVDGYAAYRLKSTGPDEDESDMQVVECISATNAGHAALWRFLFDVDLVRSITAHGQPPDDPIWWMLADPRRLKRAPSDGLWVRLIDVEKALASRSYASDGGIVIEVQDDFLLEAGGVFELVAEGGQATCRRSNSAPDITLTAPQIGATYLGGVSLDSLARTGAVLDHSPGAVTRYDQMFRGERDPWCAHHF